MPVPLPVDPALQPGLARAVAEDFARGVAAAFAAGGAAPAQELTVGDTTVRDYELLVDVPTGMRYLDAMVEPTGYHRVHSVMVVRTHRGGDDPSRDRVEALAIGRALLPDGSLDPTRHETILNFPALVAKAIAVSIDTVLDPARQIESEVEPDPAAIRAAIETVIESVAAPPAE